MTSSSNQKRPHKTLTVEQKLKLLDDIEIKSYTVLCEEYGIGKSTISAIKKHGNKLREHKRKTIEMGFKKVAKTMKLGGDEELEKAVFMWFSQKREEGIPITGPILQAKARLLNNKILEQRQEINSKVFNASSGWLWRFCQRHGIRELSIQGEKLSANKTAADEFIINFNTFIKDGDYSLSQIFNCDETGLYYKLLPQKSLVAHFEKSADGRKTQKERVTISACSNASGTIKLPLLLIGKSQNPRCFKGVNRELLPVIYKSQKNAWMNKNIFSDWFHQNCVPYIQEKLNEMKIKPKAVLLIDNCSAHPNEEVLVSNNCNIIGKFLPPNVTSLIQPMDQGVLVSLKRIYRQKILEELVLHENENISIISFLKQIDMLKIIKIISESWNEIKDVTLRRSWGKIFPLDDTSTENSEDNNDAISNLNNEEFTSLFKIVGQDINDNELKEWLEADVADKGYAHFNDEEIVAKVTNQIETENEDDTEEIEPDLPISVSNSDAMKMFDGCIAWLQQQDEANTYNLTMLHQLRELAARKRLSNLKQTQINTFLC